MKRIAAALCLVFAIRTSGQTTTMTTDLCQCAPMLLTAQSKLPDTMSPLAITWDYYAQPKTLVVHTLNNSGKDITGYTIVIRHKNPDGTLDKGGWTENTSDMLSVLIIAQMAKDPAASERMRQQDIGYNSLAAGNGIFLAGETRDMTLPGINSGSELDIAAGRFSTLTVHTRNGIGIVSNGCF